MQDVESNQRVQDQQTTPHQLTELLVDPKEEKPESDQNGSPEEFTGESTPTSSDPPPDSPYGYVIALCVLGQNAVTWGMATSELGVGGVF